MRRGDGLAERFKKGVAQLARSLFDALAGRFRARADVAAADGERDLARLTQRADKRFVAARFRAAKVVVKMRRAHGDAKRPSQRAENIEQHHRIRTARYGADHRIAGKNQTLGAAVGKNLILHASTPDRRT